MTAWVVALCRHALIDMPTMLHLPLADRSPNAGRIHRMQIRSVPLKDQLLHRMPSQVRLAHMMDDHIHQMRIQSDPGRRTAATIRPAPNHGPTAYTVRMRIPRDRSSEAMIATMRVPPPPGRLKAIGLDSPQLFVVGRFSQRLQHFGLNRSWTS